MNKDIVLSIMVSSILVTSAITPVMAADGVSNANKIESKSPTSSGKCASGKCGTEKIYSQANLSHDPQDQLVRTRDGKCGLSGQGINSHESPQQIADGKVVGGVCGK
ncbi:hypothetical protein H8I91_19070 [Serratia fonticola]|uniref:hypothetical protein n=1 Tax=Serratia fonticola TaxID=47917 RepID=UPI0016450126|nr:hypothetical protein [Serratia fonticola]MBC3252371.1 hypothetical protein [Serratia fonticola]